VAALCLAGCGAAFNYVPSLPSAPKPADCPIRVTLTPPSGYEEIGILRNNDFATRDIDEFKSVVRPQVCQAGGEVVMVQYNQQGFITRAAVFARR
jgi:hypothetical protein